jgi:quinone-modifying oxidoreductase subunit QmoB
MSPPCPRVATKSGKMNIVREHDFLCSAEGVAMIQNDIDNEGVTHAALCACSRRAKTEAFNFPTIAMSRGNLREGVIWIRPDTDAARETTQEMAEDYVRMACAEVKAMQCPRATRRPAPSRPCWWWAVACPA